MNLYKVLLSHGYKYRNKFEFLVVSDDINKSKDAALQAFNSYDYGRCQFHSIELLASTGQHSEPNILLITE